MYSFFPIFIPNDNNSSSDASPFFLKFHFKLKEVNLKSNDTPVVEALQSDVRKVPTIKINNSIYAIDDIPEQVLTEMDDETQEKYIELCDSFY